MGDNVFVNAVKIQETVRARAAHFAVLTYSKSLSPEALVARRSGFRPRSWTVFWVEVLLAWRMPRPAMRPGKNQDGVMYWERGVMPLLRATNGLMYWVYSAIIPIHFSGNSFRIEASLASQMPLSVINPVTRRAGVTSNA